MNRLSLGCTMLLLVSALGMPAHAQEARSKRTTSAQDAEARSLFERGRAAYELGDFEQALAHFEQAHELSGRPELLFNIGQTADRLRRDERAIEAFEGYLAERPQAENRREVENRIRALRATQQEGPKASAAPGLAASTAHSAKEERGDQPTREGFYAQAAVGASAFRDDADAAGKPIISGAGFAFDVGLGFSIIRGLALGIRLSADLISKPDFKVNNTSGEKLESAVAIHTGPFLDWYPTARERGLHLFAATAFSSLSLQEQRVTTASTSDAQSEAARGAGVTVGIGYEWAAQRDSAFGVMLRLNGATLRQGETTHRLASAALLASATWF